MLNLDKQIEEWCVEYQIEGKDRIVPNYTWISNHTLGITYFKYRSDKTRFCDVRITDVFMNHELATKAVLWHEFCHSEIWIKKGKSDGHSNAWSERLWRKPILFLLDMFYTPLLFAIVKNK